MQRWTWQQQLFDKCSPIHFLCCAPKVPGALRGPGGGRLLVLVRVLLVVVAGVVLLAVLLDALLALLD